MKTRSCFAATLFALLLVHAGSALAQQMPREDVVEVPAVAEGLCVSNIFQTNMVLQRDKPLHIWGWAQPGEQITVTFAGEQATATANSERHWKITLSSMPANATPQRMIVQGKDDEIILDNILVGDVWVLGGQSNMEFELAKVENSPLEIVSANYPQLRILTVPYGQGPESQQGLARLHEWSDWFGRHFRKGDWDECTPETARPFGDWLCFCPQNSESQQRPRRGYRCFTRRYHR